MRPNVVESGRKANEMAATALGNATVEPETFLETVPVISIVSKGSFGPSVPILNEGFILCVIPLHIPS